MWRRPSLALCGFIAAVASIKTPYGGELRLDGHNRAYRTLVEGQLVSYANKYDAAAVISQPVAFGSHKSKLVQAIREGPCAKRAHLSADDWLRLVTWIDANAPYHDRFIDTRADAPPYDMPADRDLPAAIQAVHAKRCAGCRKPEDVTRPDWIDLGQPRGSPMLAAPLAKAAGGLGKCAKPVYQDQADPDYQAVFKLIEAAVAKAHKAPRRDLAH